MNENQTEKPAKSSSKFINVDESKNITRTLSR